MLDEARKMYRRLTAGGDVHWALVPVRATARWVVLFYTQLRNDQAFIRASGMAYITLIALVPMLMLVFGILEVVGVIDTQSQAEFLKSPLGAMFTTLLGDMPEVYEFILPGLLGIDLTKLGLVGVGGLIVVSARLFMMVERAYNDIFGVPIDRGLGWRLLYFYFTITMVPAVLVTAVLGADELGMDVPWAGNFGQAVMVFTLLLIALKAFPCTKVRWRAAIAGATVSFVLLRLGGRIFPLYVTLFASDDPLVTIYGSLGLIPVFLLWLYLLWIFVLLGVEVAYVAQNFTSLVQAELDELDRTRAIVQAPGVATALEAAVRVAWAFDRGKGPVETETLVGLCHVPTRDLTQVLLVLEQGGIVVRADQGGWMPTRPSNQIPLSEVVDAWRQLTTLRKIETDPIGEEVANALKERLTGTLADGFDEWVPPGETGVLPKPKGVGDEAAH